MAQNDYLGGLGDIEGIFDIFKSKKTKVKVEVPKALTQAVKDLPAATAQMEKLAKAMPGASAGTEKMASAIEKATKVAIPVAAILAGGLVVYAVIRAIGRSTPSEVKRP